MKLADLHAATDIQRELERAQYQLREFQKLVFSDAAKKARADKNTGDVELAFTTPQLGTMFLSIDAEDTVFQTIENRLEIRIREAAEKLRRLGVEVPQDIAA